MADSFGLRRGGQYETQIVAIEREIKERVDGCMRPQCWVLKDEKDIGKMYLGKKVTTDGKGRYVYIRRYLFLLTYGFLPDRRRLETLCGNNRCVNPAHVTYARFNRTYEQVKGLLKRNWITEEQVEELYSGG